jgi:hypothetical protein
MSTERRRSFNCLRANDVFLKGKLAGQVRQNEQKTEELEEMAK